MTVSPVAVVVAAMVERMTSWLVRGRPRQFRVICENSRCSILFHLEVPGGKWQQVIESVRKFVQGVVDRSVSAGHMR